MSAKENFRVVALMSAYNEGDIISPVVGHLIENGVEVYFLDNHSTDDTVEQVSRWLGRGVIRIEEFPPEAPDSAEPLPFDWGAILRRKEELTTELSAAWFIHHDADETHRIASAIETPGHADEIDAARRTLETQIAELRYENARIAADLERIRSSTTWRATAPLRRLLDATKRIGRLSAPAAGRFPERGAGSGR